MTDRSAAAPTLVALALGVGIFQILASVLLGLARAELLSRAAARGPKMVVIATVAVVLGVVALWVLRRRPWVAAAVFALWELVVIWQMAPRVSLVGLALHGEAMAHHFAAVVSAAAIVAIGVSWARNKALGPLRTAAAGLAATGTAGLLLCHVWEHPAWATVPPGWLEPTSAALALAAWPVALVVLWPRLSPPALRIVAAVLLIPLCVRIGVTGVDALAGQAVPLVARSAVMSAVVITGIAVFFGLRPRLSNSMRILVVAMSATVTAYLYFLYRRRYGDFEDGLGGLTQSLVGFVLPYPTYVAAWKVILVTFGLFFLLIVIYSAIISDEDRHRGLALALGLVAGIGLGTPQLVLMAVAAGLLFVDTLTESPTAVGRPPPDELRTILDGAAERLGLPAVVATDSPRGDVLALRGELEGVPVDLRARPTRGAESRSWSVVVQLGVIGRGKPDFALVPTPGDDGRRPAHELGRSHRVEGSSRLLERIGDEPLDALLPLSTARVRFWSAGILVDCGPDLGGLSTGRLVVLVDALAKLAGK